MSDAIRDKVLITAAQLSELLSKGDDLVVLAIHSAAPSSGDRHRVPAAVDVDLSSQLAGPQHGDSGSRPLPEIARLQENARLWGISDGVPVVVYDHDRGLVAGRAWWVLRWAGVAEVRLLDGGFAAWRSAGYPIATTAGRPKPGTVALTSGHLPVLSADEAAVLARRGILLDSRIRANYIGGSVPGGRPARGHIPGAISAPAADNLGDDGTFADSATLRELYGALGATASRDVGVYCGAGISAAHDVLALAAIGIEAAMFPGSWSAWSADPNRPVAIGARPG